MSEANLEARIDAALSAILDDSPDYARELDALAADPEALSRLAREPELARALFVELRKLRPTALWVRDRATVALTTKRDVCLDGAICRLAPKEQLPGPEGRECWLEVDSVSAESTLRGLPSGWGVLVAGDLSQVSFAALRRAAPLRALGVVLADDTSVDSIEPGARLDLMVARVGSLLPETPAARVLWVSDTPDERQLLDRPIPSSGVVCRVPEARAWALRLASQRSGTGPR